MERVGGQGLGFAVMEDQRWGDAVAGVSEVGGTGWGI